MLYFLCTTVENTVEHIAETLERLRSSLILLQYRLLMNHKQADTWKRQVGYYRPILQDYHVVTQQLTDKKSEQEQLQTNRNAISPLQIIRHRQLAEQIAALTEEIEELRSPAQPRLQEQRRSPAFRQLLGQAGRNAGEVGSAERKPCTAAFYHHKTVP